MRDFRESISRCIQGARNQRVYFCLTVLGAVMLVGTICIAVVSCSEDQKGLIPPALKSRLRNAMDNMEAACKSGDRQQYMQGRIEIQQLCEEWVDVIAEGDQIESVSDIRRAEFCETCQIIPKLNALMTEPVCATVVANMTQMEKDLVDLDRLKWGMQAIVMMPITLACDRYVDPATGELRKAKPDELKP